MIEGFTTRDFSHDGKTRTVYRRGQGPGVLIMHEIPGITPQVARFATWVCRRIATSVSIGRIRSMC